MTAFIVACGLLILLSAWFYSFPGRRAGTTREDLERANLDWFRRRRAELEAEGDERRFHHVVTDPAVRKQIQKRLAGKR